MVLCGLDVGADGVWKVEQLGKDLLEIIAEYPDEFRKGYDEAVQSMQLQWRSHDRNGSWRANGSVATDRWWFASSAFAPRMDKKRLCQVPSLLCKRSWVALQTFKLYLRLKYTSTAGAVAVRAPFYVAHYLACVKLADICDYFKKSNAKKNVSQKRGDELLSPHGLIAMAERKTNLVQQSQKLRLRL
ncbi:hypothetical protein GQ600_691 [Phytophthora cactorum]|nr:hypothetical protein GQ600_691 [Phytophthora cactorum]